MASPSFSNRIYLGITGEKDIDWQRKVAEINEFGLQEAAVFLERLKKPQREKLYKALLCSSIKWVPLVHLRGDLEKKEIRFFLKNFKTSCFNIHEEHFKVLDKWKGYWDKLYLELNYDNKVAEDVRVEKIGGFCIDFSHFKSAIARGGEEAYYVFLRKHKIKFTCNHVNGYSPSLNRDLHTVTSLRHFNYLTTLPKYVFGKIIALEVENSIKDQIIFKEHITRLLDKYFKL